MGAVGQELSLRDLEAGRPAVPAAQTAREAWGTGRRSQPLVSQPPNAPRRVLRCPGSTVRAPSSQDTKTPGAQLLVLVAGPTLRRAARSGPMHVRGPLPEPPLRWLRPALSPPGRGEGAADSR